MKLDDKDKLALDLPFGRFLEERFFASVSEAGTSANEPRGKAVADLVAEADRVLGQYKPDQYETDKTLAPMARESFDLSEGHVVDRSMSKDRQRITRIRRQDGTPFYIYSSGREGTVRAAVDDLSVWIRGGSKILVSRATHFYRGGNRKYEGPRPPYEMRYTRVAEVGLPHIEDIAASLKKNFPPPVEQWPTAKKPAKRRWF